MSLQVAALALFALVFAVATWRNLHLGIAMLPAACLVGVWLAGMPVGDVLAGFPIQIAILLAGVTYFFGIAHENGTIDALMTAVLARVSTRAVALPFVFFGLTAAVAAMGSPLAGLVMAPIGMPLAKRLRIAPVLMAMSIACGISAGGFAPTSLFGIVTSSTAEDAGVELEPFALFAVGVVANLALLCLAFAMFGGFALRHSAENEPVLAPRGSLTAVQRVTLGCMFALLITVIAASAVGLDPNIGVLCFAFGALLALLDARAGRAAIARIDWSTVLLVGGIITYVGVLQALGAVELLGESAAKLGTPFLTALAVCVIGALVSAFASTTGVLAALVPLALPLVASGNVAGWAMISALAVCSSIVDVSPFSTVGATLVATTGEDDRPRVTSWLMRWGLSLIVLGPIALVLLLVWPASL